MVFRKKRKRNCFLILIIICSNFDCKMTSVLKTSGRIKANARCALRFFFYPQATGPTSHMKQNWEISFEWGVQILQTSKRTDIKKLK